MSEPNSLQCDPELLSHGNFELFCSAIFYAKLDTNLSKLVFKSQNIPESRFPAMFPAMFHREDSRVLWIYKVPSISVPAATIWTNIFEVYTCLSVDTTIQKFASIICRKLRRFLRYFSVLF